MAVALVLSVIFLAQADADPAKAAHGYGAIFLWFGIAAAAPVLLVVGIPGVAMTRRMRQQRRTGTTPSWDRVRSRAAQRGGTAEVVDGGRGGTAGTGGGAGPGRKAPPSPEALAADAARSPPVRDVRPAGTVLDGFFKGSSKSEAMLRLMKTRARMGFGAASLVLALALTGCGGGGDTNDGEVASVGKDPTGGKSSAAPGASSELAEYVEAKRKWVACLREDGLDAPDPDAKGNVDLGDARKAKQDPKFLAAQEKCQSLVVPVPDSLEREMQPELSAQEIARKKQYATCMQENGAPDFPDTDDKGFSREVAWDSTSAGAKRAQRACGEILGIPDDGSEAKG